VPTCIDEVECHVAVETQSTGWALGRLAGFRPRVNAHTRIDTTPKHTATLQARSSESDEGEVGTHFKYGGDVVAYFVSAWLPRARSSTPRLSSIRCRRVSCAEAQGTQPKWSVGEVVGECHSSVDQGEDRPSAWVCIAYAGHTAARCISQGVWEAPRWGGRDWRQRCNVCDVN
jgi:hypothetical protein